MTGEEMRPAKPAFPSELLPAGDYPQETLLETERPETVTPMNCQLAAESHSIELGNGRSECWMRVHGLPMARALPQRVMMEQCKSGKPSH